MIYSILKILLLPVHRFYYKKIIVEGKENIPKGSVIFTSNHQNAMMDAMAIAATSGRKPWFMARADMFTSAFYRFLLSVFRILPIYRKKDGKDGLKKNDDVFDDAANLLLKGKSLALFPEAGHAEHRRLQALRKGFVRIGFKALEKSEFKQEIAIVPVGIYYSEFSQFRQYLHVRYGKPVLLSHYRELYESKPQKAFNIVKSQVAKRIIPMIINIKNYDYYHTFERLISFYTERILPMLGIGPRNERNLFLARQKIIYLMNHVLEHKPQQFHDLRLAIDDHFNDIKRLGFEVREIERFENKPVSMLPRILGLVLLFPVALYGFAWNVIPYYITRISAKKAGDPHFLSTYKFGVGVLAFPLFYLLTGWGLSQLFTNSFEFLSWLLSLPLAGLIAYKWRHWFREWNVNRKLNKAVKSGQGDEFEMLKQRKALLEQIDALIEPYF